MTTEEIVNRLLALHAREEFRELGDCCMMWPDANGTALWQAAMTLQRTFQPDFDHPIQAKPASVTGQRTESGP